MNKILFNDTQTQEIIKLYNDGVSCRIIGKQFFCSKQVINKLLKQKRIQVRDNSHAHQKYNLNENIFENIDTHEKAYWLGMLAGDGWVAADDNQFGLSLQIKDKKHIFLFRKFLQSNHNIIIKYNRPKKDGSPSISYELRIWNKKIVEDLNKYGIKPNKTLGMIFPKLIDELLPSYLLGLVDSDGSICLKTRKNGKKKISFSFVAPDEFVNKFQEILIEKCDISKTVIDKHLKTKYLGIVHYGGYQQVFKIIKYIYNEAPIWLARKKDIAINFLLTKYPNDEWLNAQVERSAKLFVGPGDA